MAINSPNRAEQLLNASASAILEVDGGGVIQFASKPIFGLFGYTPAEIEGASIEVLIPKSKRKGHSGYFKSFLNKPRNRSMGMGASFPGLHKLGHEINISIGLSLLDHQATTIVVTITESNLLNRVETSLKDKELEASLSQDENARLLSMVHHSQNVVMLVESELQVQWVNRATTKSLGYADHEVIGKHPLWFLSEQNNAEEVKVLNKALEQQLSYDGVLRFTRKDTNTIWMSLHVHPNFDNERFLGFVLHLNDIDEQQALLEKVSRQNDTLETTAKIARLGTWELDLLSNDLYWSAEVYKIHEIPLGQPIDVNNAINFYAPEARPIVTEAIQKCMETGSKWDLELPFITAKKNRIWVRAVGYAEFKDGKPMRLKGAFQDITQLKNAVEASNAASKAKSLFLANMSHEIRTPINGVLGMTELLLLSKLNKKQQQYANIVKQSADSLLHLINELLDFSKLEAGKLQLRLSDFDLRNLVTERAQWHVHSAEKKGVAFRIQFADDVPSLIYADAERLGQVITNLCTNAVKFTHSGAITLAIEKNTQSELLFKVTDTGIGLSDSQISAIFEEFEQADNSSTRKYSGTGLGLSISEQLVSLMQGKIWVESELGQGSTFAFTLPFEIATQKEQIKAQAQSIAPTMFITVVPEIETGLQQLAVKKGLDFVVLGSVHEALSDLKRSQRWQNIVVFAHGIDNPALVNSSLCRFTNDTHLITWVCSKEDDAFNISELSLASPILEQSLSSLNTRETSEALLQVFAGLQQQTRPSVSISTASLQSKKMLIVEDNEINQAVITEMLRDYNIQIDIANNGVEAVAKVKQNGPYNSILMDCQMPVMDGYEATKIIRSMGAKELAEQPIIAATAHGMEVDLKNCLDAGMNDYLVKPFTQEQLTSALMRNMAK